jgi:hypothetical protein
MTRNSPSVYGLHATDLCYFPVGRMQADGYITLQMPQEIVS